ncbi:hypothetical protein DPMN_144449 [Dreissena polymorpha]|uniref:Uncharacterized protein n=1 Tax=Dreissena polymorpha TaxID=45954 RepID=A0A9D4GL42_DREPO|nr:hypothetical protein DPMN_144449 [Dreissena polymorpha]
MRPAPSSFSSTSASSIVSWEIAGVDQQTVRDIKEPPARRHKGIQLRELLQRRRDRPLLESVTSNTTHSPI